MTSNQRKLELHEELRQARLERKAALAAMVEARGVYLDRKDELRSADGAVEEILEEIETGKTPRPLIDLANGRRDPTPATNGVHVEAKPDAPAKGRKKAPSR